MTKITVTVFFFVEYRHEGAEKDRNM